MKADRPNHPGSAALLRAWTVLLLLTLAWDASGLDMAVMRRIGTPAGFPWQHHDVLERVLHDGLRQVAWLGLGLLLAWAAGAPDHPGAPPRRERWLVAALVGLSLLVVNLFKLASRTSCPWDWSVFGGQAAYVSHWALLASDGGPGHCFPGGHASSALAFLPLCLPWLCPPGGRSRHPVAGRLALTAALAAGAVAGAAQTLRGAHPPSHTLWTALVCGGVALGGWGLASPWLRAGRVQRPARP